MDKKKKAVIFLLFTTLFWGGNFVVGKMVVSSIPPFTMAVIRWGIALVLLLMFLYKNGGINWKELKPYRKQILVMAITGVFGFNTLVYFAVQYTTSINAALVNALSPAVILIMSAILLKDKLASLQMIGVTTSFIGVLVVVSSGSIQTLLQLQFNTGDIIMVVAVMLWAIYSIQMKKVTKYIPSFTIITLNAIVGFVMLIPFAIWELSKVDNLVFNTTSIVGLLYIGIFASFLAFLGWNEGVIHLGPSKAGVFLNLIPVFSAILSYILLGEKASYHQMLGGLLVIIGVIITNNESLIRKRKTCNHLVHEDV